MPLKMMYPVQLHPDTKCPNCNTELAIIAPGVYACRTGHVVEPVIFCTVRPKPKQTPVKLEQTLDTVETGIKQ